MGDDASRPLRLLLVEDQPADAELIVHELRRSGFHLDWRRVDTEADYSSALSPALDVILADFSLPSFSATRALEILKHQQLDVPFIVVSGSIGEEIAVATVRNGAADYLLKDRLTRLGQAIHRATQERRLRQEMRSLEEWDPLESTCRHASLSIL